MASAVSVPVGVSPSGSSSTTRHEKRSVRRRDPGREGIGVGRHSKVVFGQLLRLFLSGDNLVLDPVIDVRRYDLAVCEIVFPVIRAAGDDRFGTGGTDARQLIQSSGLAEFISTNSPAGSDLPVGLSVALGVAAAGGFGVVGAGGLGDLGGGVVCATTGSARSTLNPIAARYCPSFMVVPSVRFQQSRGRSPLDILVEWNDRAR